MGKEPEMPCMEKLGTSVLETLPSRQEETMESRIHLQRELERLPS